MDSEQGLPDGKQVLIDFQMNGYVMLFMALKNIFFLVLVGFFVGLYNYRGNTANTDYINQEFSRCDEPQYCLLVKVIWNMNVFTFS